MAYGKLRIEEIIARRNVNPLSASFPALGNGGAAEGCCASNGVPLGTEPRNCRPRMRGNALNNQTTVESAFS